MKNISIELIPAKEKGIKRACVVFMFHFWVSKTSILFLMASAIVRAALTSAVIKTPSSSLKSSIMKEKAEEILTKASVEEETFDKFSEGM